MMRPSRIIRRGTFLSFAIAVGALFVSAAPAMAAPMEFDDPQGGANPNFLYVNPDQGAMTLEVGLCLTSDQGPLVKGYYYLNVPQSDPTKGGGSPLPGSPGTPKPCPTNGVKQSPPIVQKDGALFVLDPTGTLISQSAANPGFVYAKPDQAGPSLEVGLCVTGGPTPLVPGYYYLNVPQSDPTKGGGSPLPGSPGTPKPCPVLNTGGGGGQTANLGLTMTGPSSVTQGDTISYQLTASNAGPNDAAATQISDTLPSGTTFVSASPSCTHTGNAVNCSLGTVANGASSSVTISVRADSVGSKTNSATVSSSTTDPSSANNTKTVTTTVNAAEQQQQQQSPNTKAKGPKSTTSSRPAFSFSSNKSGAKFECRIDRKGKFKSCKKHFRPSKGLKPGKHLLEVRAVANGKRDPTPAKLHFTVKRHKK